MSGPPFRSLLAAAALLASAGCAVNPNTGRNQLMFWPAAQTAEADLGYSLTTGDRPAGAACAVDAACPSAAERMRFGRQVARIGSELEAQARSFAPEAFKRIGAFQIEVRSDMSTGTASSAGGRIALAAHLAAFDPTDDAVAFLIAREMAHVIARHHEEDAGARLAFSALTALVPGASVLAKFAASIAGPSALTGAWAEDQRREADELALKLLARTQRTPQIVALNLRVGLERKRLPPGAWTAQLDQSIARVCAIAALQDAELAAEPHAASAILVAGSR